MGPLKEVEFVCYNKFVKEEKVPINGLELSS